MSIDLAYAVAAVSDLEVAKEFYARLLTRPADLEPMPGLAQWDLPSGGVQVVESPDHAGHSMVTLLVSDFDEVLSRLVRERLEPGEVVDGVVSRLFELRDPDGNVVTVAEVPPQE